jgi:hypothetical protein
MIWRSPPASTPNTSRSSSIARSVPTSIRSTRAGNRDADARTRLVPLTRERVAHHGKPAAYVCYQRICQLPTDDPERFEWQSIDASRPRENEPKARSTRKTKDKND